MCVRFIKFLVVFASLFLCFSSPVPAEEVESDEEGCQEPVQGVNLISGEELIALARREERYVLLDVRRKQEWLAGHIDTSINIPVGELTAQELSKWGGKDDPVIVYCDGISCQRSIEAVKKIISSGWKKIYWLQGGLAEWSRQGYPQVKGLK